ncbi:hypothetical protein MCAG_00107 [Micromonospora sp. ATCC 39149]|uniref:Uncharacterized protein n=1 Tax=Micromonospora carbonacea TaxID=47853 RepID=A0A7D5YAK6_9ACTN|nr:hypothetical protein [Micromonospora sp. ATCC 39149]EEP69780.1 hypothetical protein MCAG_00107 [Micromonospora sp. ATCC 39149]QLJ96253.1 hypothetical protein HZU44_14685 [Micromonospora carbonacea]
MADRAAPPVPWTRWDRPVLWVRDPDDDPSTRTLLTGIADVDSGVVVVRTRPGNVTANELWLAVLGALGKPVDSDRFKVVPGPIIVARAARAWLIGHQPMDIVIDRAHRVPAKLQNELVAIAAAIPARLWLVDAGRKGDDHRIGVPDRLIHGKVRPSALKTLLPGQLPRPQWPAPIPDELPTADFLTFRSACARTLDRWSAKLVDQHWADANRYFQTIAPSLSPHPPAVVESSRLAVELARWIYQSASAGEALVTVRAAQAALLRNGLLLQHRPGNLGPQHLLSKATPQLIAALRTLFRPDAAAATLLELLMPGGLPGSWPARDVWPINAVDALGHNLLTSFGPVPVPRAAAPILLAQVAWRQAEGAQPAEPLLAVGQPRPFDPWQPSQELSRRTLSELSIATADTDARYPDPYGIRTAPGRSWLAQRHLSMTKADEHVPDHTHVRWQLDTR